MYKYALCLMLLILIGYSTPLIAIVPTETGQRIIEESNRIYSGNKYNLPQDQYNRLKQLKNYNRIWPNQVYYYQNYPYYNYYSSYSPYYGYGYGGYPYSGYGYGSYPYYGYSDYPYYGYGSYYGSIPPPLPNQAFPDKAEADALYRYLQGR